MTEKVNNGEVVPFSHKSCADGKAGLVVMGAKVTIAYKQKGKNQLTVGETIEVKGQSYKVLWASTIAHLNMVKAGLKLISPEQAAA